MEIEKGPVDLFPTEPTDEDRKVEETLNLGFKGLLGLNEKRAGLLTCSAFVQCGRWDLKICYQTPVKSSITDILHPPKIAKWGKNGANFENNSLENIYKYQDITVSQTVTTNLTNYTLDEQVSIPNGYKLESVYMGNDGNNRTYGGNFVVIPHVYNSKVIVAIQKIGGTSTQFNGVVRIRFEKY